MNTNTAVKIATVATVAAVAVVGYGTLSTNATLTHLYETFPEIDHKIAKKAYKKVLGMAITGKLDTSTTNYTTEKFDQLFLEQVAKLSTNK